jgi:hypothetical protein
MNRVRRQPSESRGRFDFPLLATYLLTGGRESEVTGLELDDVSLDRKTITFRPNAWRRLKTPGSHRVVRLWSQLEETLGPYLHWRLLERGGQLLFPSPWSEPEQPIRDVRGLLDRIAARAGVLAGDLRTKMFRHTYCAARLQTLDRGAPVSTYTVARELGHESEAMVRRVYAHLGEVRHRSEVVECRVAQHLEQIGDRLQKLGIVTGNVTADSALEDTKKPREAASVRAPVLALSAWYTTGTWFFHLDPLRDSLKWRQASHWVDSRLRPFLREATNGSWTRSRTGGWSNSTVITTSSFSAKERTLAELREFLSGRASR